ncbi:MAG: phosphate transporter substrate-binding protein [Betaproteobacteria bacterium]|nr:phosphate transporter substrate-binding protein [Betaproteobacteria bacterium]
MVKTKARLAAFWFALGCALAGAASAQTAKPAPAKSPSGKPRLILAVSEGTSGGIDAAEALLKYQPLASVIGKALNTEVSVILARNFEQLEENMKNQTWDLVMARPSDYPARAVRDYKYALVTTANPDGMCTFIVRKNSPMKRVEDAKGARIVLPETNSYMAKFCRAELRDHGIIAAAEPKLKYVREQDVVGYSIETDFGEIGGVASYSGVARNWEKKGGRILARSIKQPYFPLVAGPRITPEEVAHLREALLQLGQSDDGKKVLATIGIQGFVAGEDKRLLDLLKWLGT